MFWSVTLQQNPKEYIELSLYLLSFGLLEKPCYYEDNEKGHELKCPHIVAPLKRVMRELLYSKITELAKLTVIFLAPTIAVTSLTIAVIKPTTVTARIVSSKRLAPFSKLWLYTHAHHLTFD